MDTTEFKEFLTTLLNEVQDRAVEQYARATSFKSEAELAWAPRSPSAWNLAVNKAIPRLETQTSNFQSWPPDRPSYHSSATLESRTSFTIDSVARVRNVEEDMGRVVSLPAAPRGTMPTPRGSLQTWAQTSKRSILHTGMCVINPENAILRYWDAIALIAMAFVALVSPVQVALMETQLDAMFVVTCVVDFIFIVDMVLQFFLMYNVTTRYGNRLEHRHSRIVVHYLRTWFVVDFLSVIPFDLLALLVQSNDVLKAKGLKIFRLLRMLKMMRMLKAARLFRRLETSLLVTNTFQVLHMQKFVFYLVLISHWLACLWALTFSLVDSDSPRWVDTFEDSELAVSEKTKDSVWKIYVAALYFTAYTMTSVGYGDVTPVNILERTVCILILFISGIVWACVIGQVTSIVSNLDAHEQEFRRLMDNLNHMMRERELPHPVRKRLRTFFISAQQAQRNEQQEQILRRMSPFLQGEVALRSNWHWVNKVSFIKNLVPEVESSDVTRAPHVVVDIALALSSVVFAQSEVFGEQRALYILRKGLVLSGSSGRMTVFCVGDVWGEDFVLSRRSLRHSEVRLAMTYCEVFQLTLADFMKVMQRHAKNRALQRRLRRFVVRLSARRAILVEAKWRRCADRGDESHRSSLVNF